MSGVPPPWSPGRSPHAEPDAAAENRRLTALVAASEEVARAELDRVQARGAQRVADAVAAMCDAENRANSAHNEAVRLRNANHRLRQEMLQFKAISEEASSLASSVKVTLAVRLEQLISDNKQLRVRLSESDERVGHLLDANKVLAFSEAKARKRVGALAGGTPAGRR